MRDWSEQLCLVVDIEPGQLRQLGHAGEAVSLDAGGDSCAALYGGEISNCLRAVQRRHSVSDESLSPSCSSILPSDQADALCVAPDSLDRLGWTLMMELEVT